MSPGRTKSSTSSATSRRAFLSHGDVALDIGHASSDQGRNPKTKTLKTLDLSGLHVNQKLLFKFLLVPILTCLLLGFGFLGSRVFSLHSKKNLLKTNKFNFDNLRLDLLSLRSSFLDLNRQAAAEKGDSEKEGTERAMDGETVEGGVETGGVPDGGLEAPVKKDSDSASTVSEDSLKAAQNLTPEPGTRKSFLTNCGSCLDRSAQSLIGPGYGQSFNRDFRRDSSFSKFWSIVLILSVSFVLVAAYFVVSAPYEISVEDGDAAREFLGTLDLDYRFCDDLSHRPELAEPGGRLHSGSDGLQGEYGDNMRFVIANPFVLIPKYRVPEILRTRDQFDIRAIKIDYSAKEVTVNYGGFGMEGRGWQTDMVYSFDNQEQLQQAGIRVWRPDVKLRFDENSHMLRGLTLRPQVHPCNFQDWRAVFASWGSFFGRKAALEELYGADIGAVYEEAQDNLDYDAKIGGAISGGFGLPEESSEEKAANQYRYLKVALLLSFSAIICSGFSGFLCRELGKGANRAATDNPEDANVIEGARICTNVSACGSTFFTHFFFFCLSAAFALFLAYFATALCFTFDAAQVGDGVDSESDERSFFYQAAGPCVLCIGISLVCLWVLLLTLRYCGNGGCEGCCDGNYYFFYFGHPGDGVGCCEGCGHCVSCCGETVGNIDWCAICTAIGQGLSSINI